MTVIDATDQVLSNMGFDRPTPFSDAGIPELPQDPTILSDEDVSCLHFAYVGWLSYAESERWQADTEHKTLEAKLGRVRARTMTADGKATTVTAMKAAAALNPEVMDLEERLLAADILRSALDDVCRRCDRFASAVSREMSRRGTKPSRWTA